MSGTETAVVGFVVMLVLGVVVLPLRDTHPRGGIPGARRFG